MMTDHQRALAQQNADVARSEAAKLSWELRQMEASGALLDQHRGMVQSALAKWHYWQGVADAG